MTKRSEISFKIGALLELGKGGVEIADLLSVTIKKVDGVRTWMRRKGWDGYRTRIPSPERAARNALIEEMAEEGIRPCEIARRLGLTPNTVIGVKHRAIKACRIILLPYRECVPTRDPFPSRGHCLFPSEHEPRDPAFSFCGRPVSEPHSAWCPAHRKIVYRPRDLPEVPAPN